MKLFSTYLGPASDTLLALGAATARWNEVFVSGAISTATRLILSSGSASTMNTNILNTAGTSILNGDIWFQSSSSRMYLAIRSGGIVYYATMNS